MRRAALALGGLVLAAVLAFTAAAATPSDGVLRAKLRDVMADEERAWVLLGKTPPRYGTARLVLNRARSSLLELRRSVPEGVGARLADAHEWDGHALGWIAEQKAEGGRRALSRAHTAKAMALSALQPRRADAEQCADGRDNDGDLLADNVFDSGCSSGRDASEQSPATCTLGATATGVRGTCSGPPARIEIVAPGAGFDTGKAAVADLSPGCAYASEQKLECIFRDGQANPAHRVRVRFVLDEGVTVRIGGVRIFDFRGRRFGLRAPEPSTSPPPQGAFQVGAFITYAHLTGGRSNVCVFVTTQPPQPPLRGGVTLTGPNFSETKAFTTLGGEAPAKVVFTVTERARYVANVTLAGKTAQAAESLGLAPTTSGPTSCLP